MKGPRTPRRRRQLLSVVIAAFCSLALAAEARADIVTYLIVDGPGAGERLRVDFQTGQVIGELNQHNQAEGLLFDGNDHCGCRHFHGSLRGASDSGAACGWGCVVRVEALNPAGTCIAEAIRNEGAAINILDDEVVRYDLAQFVLEESLASLRKLRRIVNDAADAGKINRAQARMLRRLIREAIELDRSALEELLGGDSLGASIYINEALELKARLLPKLKASRSPTPRSPPRGRSPRSGTPTRSHT